MSPRRAALAMLVGVLAACEGTGDGEPTVVHEIDFGDALVDGAMPTLPEPFSPQETHDLRTGFDWALTAELPERDPDGHPALRYGIVYLATEDQRALLDAMEVQHNTLPLFESERARWDDMVGRFGHFGDGEGIFHFAIFPASVYNALRDLALEGRPPFAAFIVRDAPAEASNEDGSLSYGWLADRGFRMQLELAQDPPPEGLREEPFLIEFITLIATSRDARDGVDDVLGALNRAGRAGTMSVTLFTGTTDAIAPLVRAWGANGPPGTNAGSPLVLQDVEVVTQLEVGTSRARADRNGVASLAVAVGSRIFFCVRANNFAVQVDEGFEAIELCSFRRGFSAVVTAVDGGAVFVLAVDPVFNLVAQMTDGNQYAQRVMGHTVSHRASVLVGPFADIFGAFNGNLAFAVCGSYTSAINGLWIVLAELLGRAVGLVEAVPRFLTDVAFLSLPVIVAKMLAHDIIFPAWLTTGPPGPAGDTWSRGVPTHEYGHFLTCDLLSTRGGDGDFTEAWFDVLLAALFSGQIVENENLWIAESIADYFAAQIAGGTNYFGLRPASGTSDRALFYCDPTQPDCLEDNIGGPSPVATVAQIHPAGDPFNLQVARIVTLLHDAVDGPPRALPAGVIDQPTTSGFWTTGPGRALPLRPFVGTPVPDRGDEEVRLSGAFMSDTIRLLTSRGNTLNRRNFLGSLARVARRQYTEEQVCQMFALHEPTGMCTGLADARDLSAASVAPSVPLIVSSSVTRDHRGIWNWRDMSPLADGYAMEIQAADGTFVVARTGVPYVRVASHLQRELPPDTELTFRVATSNGAVLSAFAESTVHSYAERATGLAGSPLAGAAALSWDDVVASEFLVRDLTSGTPREVTRTREPSITVSGLAGGVPYTFDVVSLNAIGMRSDPSDPVTVTPIAPTRLHVATFGNDTAPMAGTPASPFRTIAAAIAAAGSMPTEIVVHSGTYSEVAPLTISGDLTIRGGWVATGGVWAAALGLSVVNLSGGADAPASCSTHQFNGASLATAGGILVTRGAVVTLDHLDVIATRGSVGAMRCFAALATEGADITLDDVVLENHPTSPACDVALSTIGGDVIIRASSIAGAVTTVATLPAASDIAAVASCGSSLDVADTTITTVAGSSLGPSGAVGQLVGVTGRALLGARIGRSTILVHPNLAWHATAGELTGLGITTDGSLTVHDTLVRTPHGGDVNRAIDVASDVGEMRSLALYHVTATVGDDWDLANPVPVPFDGAPLSMAGSIRDLALYNNLLAFAGGSVDGMAATIGGIPRVVYTGIDRVRTTADPITLAVAGNIVSVPFVDAWPTVSLLSCGNGLDFGRIDRASDLNAAPQHACFGGARAGWVVARNAGFTRALGDAVPDSVVDLAPDGYPVDDARVFIVGEPFGRLPRPEDVLFDVGGNMRDEFLVGVGAWARR